MPHELGAKSYSQQPSCSHFSPVSSPTFGYSNQQSLSTHSPGQFNAKWICKPRREANQEAG